MVVERSGRSCLLCQKSFTGRTFLCRECSDRYRDQVVPFEVRQRFYRQLDVEYPDRSNTFGSYNRPAALLEGLFRLPRHVAVLEVGAGGGFLLQELQRAGFTDLTGTDITNSAVFEIVRRVPGADVVLMDGSELSFKPCTFDVVISSDVIEHLPDVDRHLDSVVSVLKPGGLYFIKTPNRALAELYYRLRGLHDSDFWHPSMFSASELASTLESHGLEMRTLQPQRLTEAQIVKVPGGNLGRRLIGRLPVECLPPKLRPHLEVVARKLSGTRSAS